MTAEGTRLTYLSATLLSGDDTRYCLFRGPSGQAVRQASDRARISHERPPAVHLAAEGLRAGAGVPGAGRCRIWGPLCRAV